MRSPFPFPFDFVLETAPAARQLLYEMASVTDPQAD